MIGVLSAYLKTSRVQIAAALLFLLSGAMTQVPLFNYLGYEFSALMTIPASVISGTLTILWLRDHREAPLTRRTWLFVIGDYLLVNFFLLLIPFLVISFNAFSVKNCAFAKGALYYVLLPVVTMIFSIPLALVIGTVFRKGISVFLMVIGLLLTHIVAITYTQPQLFAYNFILGFFPGITYDETLTDISMLVIYRQFTFLAALMFIALFFVLLRHHVPGGQWRNMFRKIKRNVKFDATLWSVIIFCGILIVGAHLFRTELGFEFSAQDIQNRLGRRSESSHFIIYYHTDDFTAEEIRRVKVETEFHFRKIFEALKLKEQASKKIELYIYPNGEWKQKFIGTTNTNIAKPWKREIHLTSSTFRTTFRHELVHILAAEFGSPIIHASVRMGLNEGLAVALDWDEGMFTPHQFAAGIHRMNGLNGTEQLFTITGFASQSNTFAYLVSGSFVRYLLDRYGIERFRHVFSYGNFMVAFGESLESLLGDWKAFLKTVDDSELPQETVRSLFYQQSIFYKTCAREVADQNLQAMKMLQDQRNDDAEQLFRKSYANAPTLFALRGIFRTVNAQSRPSDVINLFSEVPEQSTLKINPGVLLLLGDAYYLNQQYVRAVGIYRQIRMMNYSEVFIESAKLRIQCVSDSIDHRSFFTLYYGGLKDSTKLAFVQQSLKRYDRSTALLYHLALLGEESAGQTAEQWLTVARNTVSPELQYFALLRAAEQLFATNRFELAKGIFWQAKNIAPTKTLSEQLDERIDLCDFAAMELL